MSRRIDVELTSRRQDDTWTWRAAGAKEPKGSVAAELVPDGLKVGDVVRAEAEFFVEGIEIISVQPPKRRDRKEPELLELMGSGNDEQLVTTTLVPKRDRGRRGRDDRGGREDRGNRGDRGARRGGGDGKRQGGDGDRDRAARPRPSRSDRDRRPRAEGPPPKPKPKRLRPRRVHRQAVLDGLSEEQKPIAEQVLRGGVPAVRQAIEEQNRRNAEQGSPEINPAPLVTMAEELLPSLKAAEWRDRAEAAAAGIDEVDIRDIRSVVVAAETGARDDEARQLAEQLRTGLAARVEREHNDWLREIADTLSEGRTVRALRLSSRPPKAGSPLPADLAARLTAAANEALGSDVAQERWAIVLDAVAYSPVRAQVEPGAFPAEPNEELLKTVRKIADRVPEIAARLGVEPKGRRGPKRAAPKPPPPPPAPTAPPKQDVEQPVAQDVEQPVAQDVEQPSTPEAEQPATQDSEEGVDDPVVGEELQEPVDQIEVGQVDEG